MANTPPKYDYDAFLVSKGDRRDRKSWLRIGVGFLNEKPGPNDKPVQTISIKTNTPAGVTVDLSQVDIVLLPPNYGNDDAEAGA